MFLPCSLIPRQYQHCPPFRVRGLKQICHPRPNGVPNTLIIAASQVSPLGVSRGHMRGEQGRAVLPGELAVCIAHAAVVEVVVDWARPIRRRGKDFWGVWRQRIKSDRSRAQQRPWRGRCNGLLWLGRNFVCVEKAGREVCNYLVGMRFSFSAGGWRFLCISMPMHGMEIGEGRICSRMMRRGGGLDDDEDDDGDDARSALTLSRTSALAFLHATSSKESHESPAPASLLPVCTPPAPASSTSGRRCAFCCERSSDAILRCTSSKERSSTLGVHPRAASRGVLPVGGESGAMGQGDHEQEAG